MKKLAGLVILLLFTGCACGRTNAHKVVVLRKALVETNLRYDYARDQNERYSRQLKVALRKKGK